MQYARLAPGYDARWARYTARTVHGTLQGLRLAPGERVLDAGCGTGALLAALLAREPRLRATGVDLSDAMLEHARAQLPAEVALLAGDVHALPLAAARFDLVVSTSSYHFWDDKPGALAELRRVLVPGGRLVLTDWCDDFLACRLCDRVLRVADRAHAPIASGSQCTEALEAAGFVSPMLRRFRVGWLWGMMTARAERAEGLS
jgi:ubiquinone/menaquinone biosynthesis C-methylase UbiE